MCRFQNKLLLTTLTVLQLNVSHILVSHSTIAHEEAVTNSPQRMLPEQALYTGCSTSLPPRRRHVWLLRADGRALTERYIQNTWCIWNGLGGSFREERDFPQSLTRKQLNEKTKRWPHCFWAGQYIIYICFPFVQVWKDKLSSNRIKRDGCCILFVDMML